jgi:predicted thioesterase
MFEIGKTATAETTVSEKNTAITVGSGSLDVFSTPMMIALMEQAACECIASGLEDGQTSVGTAISVEHTSASPLNAEITATATIESVEKRKVTFTISAKDNFSEIGKGTHTRFIVDSARFMEKLASR